MAEAFTVVGEGDYVIQKRKEKKNMNEDLNNLHWKEDKSKFGLKMLQKMGWTEGKGLGKNETGMTEHIKAEVRDQNEGIFHKI
jgi:Pin2-interacting protein X1